MTRSPTPTWKCRVLTVHIADHALTERVGYINGGLQGYWEDDIPLERRVRPVVRRLVDSRRRLQLRQSPNCRQHIYGVPVYAIISLIGRRAIGRLRFEFHRRAIHRGLDGARRRRHHHHP